ncbi:MAG TPA: tetratricopeptide repeat protein, partial [Tenuifilaceae bacterium]|nr:tetratricopeptide repeat protein [Tenuifilaceae bacterium]HPE18940.1 tetratricopeptide repeat protein [Tenuifilaceae bacterium]HPJ46425.1 tetratricopeptide repeat protein [Tenuifilaceae bacterium]HRX67446.1 tetratricopeptide repeat protein [Tenuifilaceae bacterium]
MPSNRTIRRGVFFTGILVLFFTINVFAQQIVVLPRDKQEEVDRYLELVSRYKQAGNTEQAIFYLNKVAFTYWENNALREAVAYFVESVPLNEKIGNYADIKAIYSNIALIYSDLERFDLALEYFYKSLDARRKMNVKSDIAAGLVDVAFMHSVLNQHEKAIPLLDEALELSRNLGNPRLTLNCLRLLATSYDKIGNIAMAQRMNREFSEIEQHVAQMEIKEEYEEIVGKTQAEVERERMERMAKALELELQKLQAQATEDSLGFVVQSKQDSLLRAEEVARQRQQEIDLLEAQRELQELAQRELEAREQVQRTVIVAGAIG